MSDLVSAIDTISKLPPLSADAQRTLAAYVDPPPGPLSELFTFFVRVYLRPVDADGDWNRWARFIDLDAPMPPLRPYAISISLRPSQEMNDGMTQESYAYFLDNMIFK